MKGRDRKQRQEDELARELRNHLDLEAEERQAAGAAAEEARYAAQRALGNETRVKEEVRAMWSWTKVETFGKDLRFAARMLLKNPGFTTVAILTLGLGIGANTAIFTVVNGLMIKPLPYKDADRIVYPATVFQRSNTDRGSVSYADIVDWKAQKDLFAAVAVLRRSNFDITDGDQPERIRGVASDRDYFRVFTDAPLLGRVFGAEEDMPKANNVVVLSEKLWMRRFGGDRNVLGQTIDIGGEAHKIIGVMPKHATFPDEAEIFKPIAFPSTPDADLLRRDNHMFSAVARLNPGVSVDQAQAKLTGLAARIAQENANRARTGWKVHALRDYIIGPAMSRMLWVLLGAVVLVLLIACVNVANLLLARGAVRQRELAIRTALGASWQRLTTQFLVESSVLAFAGGALGILIGYAGALALVRYAPEGVPRLDFVSVDLTVLAFTVGLCLLTAIVFGLAPVLQATRTAPADRIREGGRSGSDGVRSARVRSCLVGAELALAVILLAGAGLLVRSFMSLQSVDPGFDTKNVLTMQVGLPRSRYAPPSVAQTFEQISAAIRSIPGVTSVATTSSLPLGGGGFYLGRVFLTTGQPEPPASKDTQAHWSVMQPGYLDTLGVRVIAGRGFNRSDTADSNPVILISQAMAKEMFPNESPLGRRIRSWRDENKYREIVGVVADVRYGGLGAEVPNNVYIPHPQDPWSSQVLVVRTDGDPRSILRSVQSAVWAQDRKLAISEVKTMDTIVATELARPRFAMFLLAVFAATALAMAAIGIYGLMSYTVAQQTREIGIRMALGALHGDILKRVAKRALVLALVGVGLGVAGALALTRLMSALLFGVSPTDAGAFTASAAILILVAVIASYVPARRASRVDPLVALRYE
jgi:putative ABC transport system permease protein